MGATERDRRGCPDNHDVAATVADFHPTYMLLCALHTHMRVNGVSPDDIYLATRFPDPPGLSVGRMLFPAAVCPGTDDEVVAAWREAGRWWSETATDTQAALIYTAFLAYVDVARLDRAIAFAKTTILSDD